MRAALLVILLAWPVALKAQQPPRLASGRLELTSAAAGSSLGGQIRGFGGPAWVGYTVDAVPGQRGCCTTVSNGICSMGCALEGGTMAGSSCPAESGTAFLEGERTANILFRVDKSEIERVRVFSPSCQIDIAGLRYGQSMTPASSAYAVLEWLRYKQAIHDTQENITGFRTDRLGLERYNGNPSPVSPLYSPACA